MQSDDAEDLDQLPSGTADLRQQVANILLERMEVIINDSVAIFPFSGNQPLDAEFCTQLGVMLLELLAGGVRDGRVDGRSGRISDLHRAAADRALSVERLFTFAYLTERTALDELALNEAVGATAEPWPLAAQLVRRASFDVLAAYTERLQQEPGASSLVDRLTTVYTRSVMQAALQKELARAERFSHELAVILFDADRLSEINRTYGFGVGDRLLERMGIAMRKFFRQHDWIGRFGEDSILVLLPRVEAEAAVSLADRVRGMVDERLGFRDHHTERRVRVTVSAAVVTVEGIEGEVVSPEQVTAALETALHRAKEAGRNRVVHLPIAARSLSPVQAAQFLEVPVSSVKRMIAEGTLATVGSGRNMRIERTALEEHKKAEGGRR